MIGRRFRVWMYSIAVIAVLALLPIPLHSIASNNSEDQLAEVGVEALRIERQRYFPPREWRSLGGMNILNYWHWAPDPWFKASRLKTAEYNEGGDTTEFRYQLIDVNAGARKEGLDERVFALEIDSKVFEYTLPAWTSWLINTDLDFIILWNDQMIFLYSETVGLTPISVFSYFLHLPFPLQDGSFEWSLVDAIEVSDIISFVETQNDPQLRNRLCGDGASHLFVRDYLSWSCR